MGGRRVPAFNVNDISPEETSLHAGFMVSEGEHNGSIKPKMHQSSTNGKLPCPSHGWVLGYPRQVSEITAGTHMASRLTCHALLLELGLQYKNVCFIWKLMEFFGGEEKKRERNPHMVNWGNEKQLSQNKLTQTQFLLSHQDSVGRDTDVQLTYPLRSYSLWTQDSTSTPGWSQFGKTFCTWAW